MFTSIIFSILGLILLIVGGEVVVKSSSKIASSLGVSPLIIGLTVVAFGTSAPELGVSLMATLNGNADIAVTNVVGSNIFNLAFILGLCGLVAPLIVNLQLLKLDIPFSILITGALFLISREGVIGKLEAIGLILTLVFYTIWLVWASTKERGEAASKDPIVKSDINSKTNTRVFNFLIFIIGIGVLVFGSRFLVQGASDLAIRAGIPEAIVGLTLVAAGTSFPELVSSLMATIRGNTDIAIGNVIGSNIFNILLILGTSAFTSENGLKVPASVIKYDIPVLLGVSILSFPLLITGRKVVRLEGLLLLLCYIGYSFHLFFRG